MQYFSSRFMVSELRTLKFFHGRSEPSPRHLRSAPFQLFLFYTREEMVRETVVWDTQK